MRARLAVERCLVAIGQAAVGPGDACQQAFQVGGFGSREVLLVPGLVFADRDFSDRVSDKECVQ